MQVQCDNARDFKEMTVVLRVFCIYEVNDGDRRALLHRSPSDRLEERKESKLIQFQRRVLRTRTTLEATVLPALHEREPEDIMGVGRRAGAANKALRSLNQHRYVKSRERRKSFGNLRERGRGWGPF